MHQNLPKPVAPLNSQPVWPAGYATVLREAGAQEKSIPYCLSWVRAFFARNPGRRRRDLGRAQIETFLSELAVRPEINNWQVQQARDALELYYEQFRGIPLEPRGDGSVRSAKPSLPSSARQVPPNPVPSRESPGTATPAVMESYSLPPPAGKDLSAVANPSVPGDPTGHRQPSPTPTQGQECASSLRSLASPAPPRVNSSGTNQVNWPALEGVVRERLRIEHYSYRTEQTYLAWIRRFVVFHGWRKPSRLQAPDVEAFLRHLATEEQVASSTQNQAA